MDDRQQRDSSATTTAGTLKMRFALHGKGGIR